MGPNVIQNDITWGKMISIWYPAELFLEQTIMVFVYNIFKLLKYLNILNILLKYIIAKSEPVSF